MTCRCSFLFVLLLCLVRLGRAQEPDLFEGQRAARFAVGENVFYYVVPCQPKEAAASGSGIHASSLSLCWPVRLSRITIVNGKATASAQTLGSLFISSSEVRFGAADTQANFAFPVSSVSFRYNAKSISGYLITNDSAYRFLLVNVCSPCAPGSETATPVIDSAKAQAVYDLFASSLKDFDPVAKRIDAAASIIAVEFTPGNQPTKEDPERAMKLYGTLNQKLAEQCKEPARACVQSYARYQLCVAGATTQDCGTPPSCSATCGMKFEALKAEGATFCSSPASKSFAAVPSWESVYEEQDAYRLAHPVDRKTLHLVPSAPSPPSPVGCTVKGSYEMGQLSHISHETMLPLQANAHGPTSFPAETALRNRLTFVNPVYPPVAKAARISGIVYLRAIISKAGLITDLRVVTGPPLLQQAALEAVRQWTYKPFLMGEAPIEVETVIAVNFQFTGGTGSGTAAPAIAAPGTDVPVPQQP